MSAADVTGEVGQRAALSVRVRLAALGLGGVSALVVVGLLLIGRGELLDRSLPWHLSALGLAALAMRYPPWLCTTTRFTLWCSATWGAQLIGFLAEGPGRSTPALLAVCLELMSIGGLQPSITAALASQVAGVLGLVLSGFAPPETQSNLRLTIVGSCLAGLVLHAGFKYYHRVVGELLRRQGRLEQEAGVAAQRLADEQQERERILGERERLWADFLQAQKMETLGQLVGGVVHDLNNVLTVIRGITEHLLREASGEVAEDLRTIDTAAGRGADLTRSLLGLARPGQATREVFDLADVAQEVCRFLDRSVPRGVRIVCDAPLGAQVCAARSELTHAVLNLCVNGVDAMGSAGILTVEVISAPGPESSLTSAPTSAQAEASTNALADRPTDTQEGEVIMRISDTGTGIAASDLARIFEPYYTTKSPGKGTGLGLATARTTVLRHGGTLSARSTPGQGTIMTVRLPRVAAGKDASQLGRA